MDLPLFEDDLTSPGVIEPADVITSTDIPSALVLCFFREVIDALVAGPGARQVAVLAAAHGEHPIWEIVWKGQRLAVMHPGVGAPLAAGFLEEAIALGVRAVVAVGGAGALVPELAMGHPVVVESAVRDEGTSFHYLPPSRTVVADVAGVSALVDALRGVQAPFVVGRTWTTAAGPPLRTFDGGCSKSLQKRA